MPTYTLQASDDIIHQVKDFLNQLSSQDFLFIKTTETELTADYSFGKKDMAQLGGILSAYTTHKISNHDINQAITQGVIDRVYPK
ncbi:MAG: hypothetical protein Q4G13_07695 [Moraxella sp.]|nr:hypothetical protein [Moraxella sp.]